MKNYVHAQLGSFFLALLITTNVLGQIPLTVDQSDELIAQWVSIEQQNGHLKQQWQDTKTLLQQHIALLKQEEKHYGHLIFYYLIIGVG